MLQALAGLPDGMFDCTELQFGNISEVPGMEHVGKFYCHCVCLWPLVSFCSHLVHYIVLHCISRFCMLYQEKSGNPGRSVSTAHFLGEHKRPLLCHLESIF
jgi:hypothetical protein